MRTAVSSRERDQILKEARRLRRRGYSENLTCLETARRFGVSWELTWELIRNAEIFG